MFHNPLKTSILVYLVAFALFYILKPRMMFTQNKKIRHFGTSLNKTILPIWLVSAILGILSYNLCTLIKYFLLPLYNKLVLRQIHVNMKCD